MDAKRRFTMRRRDDAGASEVIGFIFAFLISSLVLILAMNSFTDSQETSDDVVTAVELRSVATRVASRVLEASIVAENYPNATYEMLLHLPPPPGDREYVVKLTSDAVEVRASKGQATASTTTYRLDEVDKLVLSGEVASWHSTAVIRYELDSGTGMKIITIKPYEV